LPQGDTVVGHPRVANHRISLRQRVKIYSWIIGERRALHVQPKIRSRAPPICARDLASRPIAREQPAIVRKYLGIRRRACRRSWQLKLQARVSRDANLFANQPVCLRYQFHRGATDCGWRCDFLHEQDFVLITVGLNIAGVCRFNWNRPLDFADFPTWREFPFDLGRKSRIAGELPIGMPTGGHSKQQPNRERLTRDYGVRICQQFRFNKLFSLICLALAARGENKDR